MSEETKTNEVMSDDELIKYTQKIRVQVVDAIMTGGKVPSANEDRSLMLKALNDISVTAIGNKRITVEENAGASVAKLANDVLTNIMKANAKLVIYSGEGNEAPRDMTQAADEIPEFQLVPGEGDINPPSENITEFKNRTQKEF